MLLSGANTIDLLYERGLAPLPKAEFAARQIRRYHERYQWFLGLALVLLVAEMFLPERRAVRRTETIVNAANAGLKKAFVTSLLITAPCLLWSSPSQGMKLYEAGKFAAALREYEQALKASPSDPKLNYNAGAAAFQAKEFETALQHFNGALITQDLLLQQRTYYNLGNTQYRRGETAQDPAQRKNAWEQSISSYESALKLNGKDSDAQFNLDFVKKKLEELKKEEDKKDSDQQPPSEEAKQAKAQADEAVKRRNYQQALDIMEQQLKRDPSTGFYGDYIERLRQINGIHDSPKP
jgi:Ca-activated chloride channel family protein